MKEKSLRRMYRREAAAMLLLARLALRVLPARRILDWAARPPRRICRFADGETGWIAWAVEAVGETTRAQCLPRALAAQAMLRRRGITSRLCLGVAKEGGGALAAHAWIELANERAVVGGNEARRFTRLVEFGGARA
jgi:hypothetical protein